MEREVSCSGGACSVQRGSFRERAPGNGCGGRAHTLCTPLELFEQNAKWWRILHYASISTLHIPGACIISLVFQLNSSEFVLCQRDATHAPTAYNNRHFFASLRLGLGLAGPCGRPAGRPPAFRVSCR